MRFSVMMGLWCIWAMVAVAASAAYGQTGAKEYASRLNVRAQFRHDPSYGGAEVIYWSSGRATPSMAHQAWLRSPGHRALVLAGKITDVRCVGHVCVGRGGATVSHAAVRTVSRPGVDKTAARVVSRRTGPVRRVVRRVLRR